MSKLHPTIAFKWIYPKELDPNKYTSKSSKGCVIKVDTEYPKESRKLLIDYLLAPDKIEIKRELLSDSPLKIGDLYIIPFC